MVQPLPTPPPEPQARAARRPRRAEAPVVPWSQVHLLLVHGVRPPGADLYFPSLRQLAAHYGVSSALIGSYCKRHRCIELRAQLPPSQRLPFSDLPPPPKSAADLPPTDRQPAPTDPYPPEPHALEPDPGRDPLASLDVQDVARQLLEPDCSLQTIALYRSQEYAANRRHTHIHPNTLKCLELLLVYGYTKPGTPPQHSFPSLQEAGSLLGVTHAVAARVWQNCRCQDQRAAYVEQRNRELDASRLLKSQAVSAAGHMATEVAIARGWIEQFERNLQSGHVKCDAVVDFDRIVRLKQFMEGEVESRRETVGNLSLQSVQARLEQVQILVGNAQSSHVAGRYRPSELLSEPEEPRGELLQRSLTAYETEVFDAMKRAGARRKWVRFIEVFGRIEMPRKNWSATVHRLVELGLLEAKGGGRTAKFRFTAAAGGPGRVKDTDDEPDDGLPPAADE